MRSRAHKHDRAAFAALVSDFVGQQKIAADVAFAGARPVALEGVVEPLGVELEIVAHFPDGDILINNFADLEAA